MIFNRFFRSKHLDPNPQVRIKAIEKLNKELSEEKSVLHELAFNDPDAGVSLAALNKLDSFSLWYKMAEISKDERVLKKATQMVEKMLFDDNSSLSEKDKRSFVSQCKEPRFLEKLLNLAWVQRDTSLALSALNRLAKPQVLEKILLETSNPELQTALVNQLPNDPQNQKLLNKLLKKSNSQALAELINQRLQQWQAEQQLPLTVEKQTRMVLSLLLALRDSQDYAHIDRQQQQLTADFASLEAQFGCLSEARQTEFRQKWQELNSKLDSTKAVLKPLWQAEQQAREWQATIARHLDTAGELLAQVKQLIGPTLSAMPHEQIEALGDSLNQQYDNIQQVLQHSDAISHQQRQALLAVVEQIIQSQESLANLPAFHQCIQQCQQLISQFSALALPTETSQLEAAQQYLRDIKQQWRVQNQRFSASLPAELNRQWQDLCSAWQQQLNQLSQQIQQDVSRCRNKLRAIEGLISQGRFRVAMELYSKVTGWYAELPESQQQGLDKVFQQVKAQIENLKDWQAYIAAPRKPALLAEAEQLAQQPLPIEQQARAVKALRQQWNSLGKLESEADQALNQAFEQHLEQAFAPCRAHYEQQQQVREQNLQQKRQVLEKISALADSVEPVGQWMKQFNQLQQQWRQIGEVEHARRHELNQQYQQALVAPKAKIAAYYQHNAEAKEALLGKAKKCAEEESLEQAIGQLKQLQAQWKGIEHAGKKAEERLWREFRQVCDEVFAKRQTQQQEHQQQVQQQLQVAEALVAQWQQLIDSATDKSVLDSSQALRSQLKDISAELGDKPAQHIDKHISRLEGALSQRLSSLEAAQSTRLYQQLFACVSAWQPDAELPQAVATLPNYWQQAFQQSHSTDSHQRHQLTLQLEIVAQQASPAEDAAARQALQIQLMAQKLQNGALDSKDELLKQWIALGPLQAGQATLMTRIQGLFN